MNHRDFIWDIAQDHASGIAFCDSRAIKIEMTEENLHEFVKHIFFMFREEMSIKAYEDPEKCQYQDGYNQAVADCMAETLVFTGEVE